MKKGAGLLVTGGAYLALMLCVSCSSDVIESEGVPSGDAEALSEADRNGILMFLRIEGFDTSSAEFVGDTVRVEDDIVFKLHDILQRSTDTVEKGQLQSKLIGNLQKVLKLRFDASVPADWKSAFEYAAARWTNATWNAKNISISITSAGTLDVDVTRNSFFTFDSCIFAEGEYPILGSPGDVRLNPLNFSGACGCTWTTSFMQKVAMHELGHVLGFKHPSISPFNWIADTELGTGYSTVMAQGCFGATSLSTDDRESAAVVYGF
jgi:hypothetical protein